MEIKIKTDQNELSATMVSDGKEAVFDYISFVDWLYKNKGAKPAITFDDKVSQSDKDKINALIDKIIEKTIPAASSLVAENESKES